MTVRRAKTDLDLELPTRAFDALRAALFCLIAFGVSQIYPPAASARVVAGIAPHHEVAAPMIERFYSEIAKSRAKRVWLFSPDHYSAARTPALVCASDTGGARVDGVTARELASHRLFEARSEPFKREHGIYVHLPYIARAFPGAAVVPVLIRKGCGDLALLSVMSEIYRMSRSDDIYILSMDFSHYKDPEGLRAEDERSIPILLAMRAPDTRGLDIDARSAASVVLMLARRAGARRGTLLERSDTTEQTGEHVPSGTSYATIVYKDHEGEDDPR